MKHPEGIGFWQAVWYLVIGTFGVVIFEILLEMTSNYISGDSEPERVEQESDDEETVDEEYFP